MSTMAGQTNKAQPFRGVLNIKGPILQYELRIRRLWKCPKCSRTVRTRGEVTSRRCSCDESQAFMEMVDAPGVQKFDASAFVTYNNEKDSNPTERELVEELPEYELSPTMQAIADGKEIEKPLRRGVGYLRAEVDEDAPESDESSDDDFGANIDDLPPASGTKNSDTRSNSPTLRSRQSSGSTEQVEKTSETRRSEDGKPSKRRRGRRRRPREGVSSPESSASAGPVGTAHETAGSGTGDDSPVANVRNESGSDATAANDEEPKKKPRRRRRRRRRSSGGQEGGGGDGAKPPATTD